MRRANGGCRSGGEMRPLGLIALVVTTDRAGELFAGSAFVDRLYQRSEETTARRGEAGITRVGRDGNLRRWLEDSSPFVMLKG